MLNVEGGNPLTIVTLRVLLYVLIWYIIYDRLCYLTLVLSNPGPGPDQIPKTAKSRPQPNLDHPGQILIPVGSCVGR